MGIAFRLLPVILILTMVLAGWSIGSTHEVRQFLNTPVYEMTVGHVAALVFFAHLLFK